VVSLGYHTCEKCQAITIGRRYQSDQRYRRHETIWVIYNREKKNMRNMIVFTHGKMSKAVVRKKMILSPLQLGKEENFFKV